MTENEWLNCINPDRMLEFVYPSISSRKARLFACACVRQVWHLLTEEPSRNAVEVAELYADGWANDDELEEADRKAFSEVRVSASGEMLNPAEYAAWWMTSEWEEPPGEVAENTARWVEAAVGELNPRAVHQIRKILGNLKLAAVEKVRKVQCQILRDLLDSPFRETELDSMQLPGASELVRRLAQTIYDEGTYDGMPILADALEEAGCTNTDILNHCRGPEPHVRGCWVIDLLLGKS